MDGVFRAELLLICNGSKKKSFVVVKLLKWRVVEIRVEFSIVGLERLILELCF